jgi:hypothetical protein
MVRRVTAAGGPGKEGRPHPGAPHPATARSSRTSGPLSRRLIARAKTFYCTYWSARLPHHAVSFNRVYSQRKTPGVLAQFAKQATGPTVIVQKIWKSMEGPVALLGHDSTYAVLLSYRPGIFAFVSVNAAAPQPGSGRRG